MGSGSSLGSGVIGDGGNGSGSHSLRGGAVVMGLWAVVVVVLEVGQWSWGCG